MKTVKYTIIGTLIGLTLGGLLSIGVVGRHSSCEGAKGCLSCVKLSAGGCGGCVSFWITPIKPFVYGTCGCFGIGCDDGCIDGWDCDDGCIDGCEDGLDNGCDECNKGCGDCGTSKCDKGCTKCANGCDNDCEHTQEELSNDPDAKKKIKNYLIYLTIIGTVVGAVFGIVLDIQETKEKIRKAEDAEKALKQKIEEAERKRKQMAESKWREMRDWLS